MRILFVILSWLAMSVPLHAEVETQSEPATGLAVWDQMFEVISHPRCVNCHVDEKGVPMWSGPSYGSKPRPHGMNIVAGDSRDGSETLPCKTCHGLENAPFPHGPPGAEGWRLPPPEFAWFEKTSAEVCAQFGDPDKNGGRSLEDLAEHAGHDALLFWAWHPGPGREPAPYSQEEFAQMIRAWGEAGAPCPLQSSE